MKPPRAVVACRSRRTACPVVTISAMKQVPAGRTYPSIFLPAAISVTKQAHEERVSEWLRTVWQAKTTMFARKPHVAARVAAKVRRAVFPACAEAFAMKPACVAIGNPSTDKKQESALRAAASVWKHVGVNLSEACAIASAAATYSAVKPLHAARWMRSTSDPRAE